jgi:catechol 2,3-dioxygenase-like lactoylglutathione lyase family enzyme
MVLQLNHVHLKTHDPENGTILCRDSRRCTIVGKAGNNGYRLDLHGLSLNVTTFLESQTREQKYGMEHIAIDTDELDNLVEKLQAQDIHILEQTTISGGRRVCFFEGPDGVQLEFIEMKSSVADSTAEQSAGEGELRHVPGVGRLSLASEALTSETPALATDLHDLTGSSPAKPRKL